MFESVLPRQIDHSFRGPKLAVWLFGLILVFKTFQGFAVLFGGAALISAADGVPLDTYPPPAAGTIVSLWALLVVARLLICLLCFLVLVRYRSLVPFMFGLLLLQDVGRHLVFHFLPIARVGTPLGPTVNIVLMALTIVGLMLCLWPQRHPPAQKPKV